MVNDCFRAEPVIISRPSNNTTAEPVLIHGNGLPSPGSQTPPALPAAKQPMCYWLMVGGSSWGCGPAAGGWRGWTSDTCSEAGEVLPCVGAWMLRSRFSCVSSCSFPTLRSLDNIRGHLEEAVTTQLTFIVCGSNQSLVNEGAVVVWKS